MPTQVQFTMIGGSVFVSSVEGSVSEVERQVSIDLLSEGFVRHPDVNHGLLLLRVSQVQSVHVYDTDVMDGE